MTVPGGIVTLPLVGGAGPEGVVEGQMPKNAHAGVVNTHLPFMQVAFVAYEGRGAVQGSAGGREGAGGTGQVPQRG